MELEAAKRLTQAEKIALKLRDMIILQQIKPNERINQDSISKQLGVSKIPLRESLKILEAEGLVYSVPYKGAFVGNITIEYVQETYYLRSVLEGISCAQATPFFDQASLTKLRQFLIQAEAALEKEELERFIRESEGFHDFIHGMSGYKRVSMMIQQLNTRSLVLRFYPEEQCYLSLKEHTFIYERIEAGDSEGAGNAMRMHVQRSGMDTVKELRSTLAIRS